MITMHGCCIRASGVCMWGALPACGLMVNCATQQMLCRLRFSFGTEYGALKSSEKATVSYVNKYDIFGDFFEAAAGIEALFG